MRRRRTLTGMKYTVHLYLLLNILLIIKSYHANKYLCETQSENEHKWRGAFTHKHRDLSNNERERNVNIFNLIFQNRNLHVRCWLLGVFLLSSAQVPRVQILIKITPHMCQNFGHDLVHEKNTTHMSYFVLKIVQPYLEQ